MADTLAHLKRDRSFWKRLLRFAGYYHGKIDWLNTKEFRYSQAKWRNETEGLRWLLGWVDMESEAKYLNSSSRSSESRSKLA